MSRLTFGIPIVAAAGVGSTDADTRGWFNTDDVQQRAIASLDLLLKAGGDVNTADPQRGSTLLHGAAFWGWNRPWLDPEFRKWNLEEYLPRIAAPILVVQGEDDEYGTRKQVDAIAAGAPDVEVLMLPRCGHSPHRDQPEATLEGIAAFLRKRVTPKS